MKNNSKKISSAKLFKTLLSLVMVLSLLVGCSLMFVGCSDTSSDKDDDDDQTSSEGGNKNDPAQYEGLSDEEYFQKLILNTLGSIFESSESTEGPGFNAGSALDMSTNLDVEIGDAVLSLLEQYMPASGANTNLDFLKKFSVISNVKMSDSLEEVYISLHLDDQEIIAMSMIMDMLSGDTYMALSSLNDTYLKYSMSDMSGSADMGYGQILQDPDKILAALPEGEVIASIIERYLTTALESAEEVERKDVTLEAGDLEQECTELTVVFSDVAIMKALLTEAKNDDELLGMIEDVVAAMGEMSGEAVSGDVSTMLKEQINALLGDLKNMPSSSRTSLALKLYVDDAHNIIGFGMTLPQDQGDIAAYTLTEGDEFSFNATYSMQGIEFASITGGGTVSETNTEGSYSLNVMGSTLMTIETNDGVEGSNLTLKPTRALMDSLLSGTNLPFKNLALTLGVDGQTVYVTLKDGSDILLDVSLHATMGNGDPITLPSDYIDGSNQNTVDAYLESLDISSVINSLRQAGVSEDLLNSLLASMG